jgi:hypothetical protein
MAKVTIAMTAMTDNTTTTSESAPDRLACGQPKTPHPALREPPRTDNGMGRLGRKDQREATTRA